MQSQRIETSRLVLIAATPQLLEAEIHNRENLSLLLEAQVLASWPPELYGPDAMNYSLLKLQQGTEQAGWWAWYFVLAASDNNARTLIGVGGYKGPVDGEGKVEVGYSVLEEFQNAGYATEATIGLANWAFTHNEVNRVIAETLPELKQSQRVLEKSGFTFIGEGSEEGVIRYELQRR